MKTYPFNEFNAEWEIQTIQSEIKFRTPWLVKAYSTMVNPTPSDIANQMMQDVVLDETDNDDNDDINFFESDYETFIFACEEIKAGRNIDEWVKIFNNFIEKYPIRYEHNNITKTVELLQIVKSEKMLIELKKGDLNKLDLLTYQEILKIRNILMTKNGINPIINIK